jgi:hypothetical protein
MKKTGKKIAWFVEQGLPVYVTSPRTVAEGIAMMERLGLLLNCQQRVNRWSR